MPSTVSIETSSRWYRNFCRRKCPSKSSTGVSPAVVWASSPIQSKHLTVYNVPFMPNRDIDATWKYHNGTKHSYLSLRVSPHFLAWENKPLLFKIYPTLEVTRLPKDFQQTGVTA